MTFKQYKNGIPVIEATNAENFEVSDSVTVQNSITVEEIYTRFDVPVFLATDRDSTRLAYSTDGITWADNAALPTTSSRWLCLTYGDGKFVALSKDTATVSTDAVSWTENAMPVSMNSGEPLAGWVSVVHGEGKFVAITSDFAASTGSSVAAYSTDAITWTQTTLPASRAWASVVHGDEKFVAISTHYPLNNTAAYSTDGITWTQTALPSSLFWETVAYGDGKFVAINNNSTSTAAYSTNGITWTNITLPYRTYGSITHDRGTFFATPHPAQTGLGNRAAISTDGITWTETTMPPSSEVGWSVITSGVANRVDKINGFIYP